MTSLWWPGDHRAGALCSGAALLHALAAVEQAWLDVLVDTGVAPSGARADVASLVGPADAEPLAVAAEEGGNPVIPLVAALRGRLPEPAARWLHRGLTSQDVLDTALVLCARDAVLALRRETGAQADLLAGLVRTHRADPMVARTLTQHAVPTTFGARAAGWLHGVLDADEDLAGLGFPAQLGGAAGTLSGLVEIAGVDAARDARAALAPALGLATSPPWHTHRAALTRAADAATRATDAWGRLANDVLALGRPEVGELVETSGGSSTMPGKANPTRAVLVRRAALAGPQLAATLHLAAAEQVDDRADGAWHAEWETLATLLRRAVVAGSQTTELLGHLRVRTDRMAARLDEVRDDALAEQRALAEVAGREPATTYDGLVDDLVEEALTRARAPVRMPDPGETGASSASRA